MMLHPYHKGWVVMVIMLIALILSIMPVPLWARYARPQWVTLVLIYWSLALPQRVNIGSAWILGITQDVISGTVLGQHALALSVVTFVVISLHLRIRIFTLWQQSFIVLLLLLLERLLELWVVIATSQPIPTLWYWMPALVSAPLWPWVYIILRDVRRSFGVR
ncbi:rod shape-determining protein MreD [Achromatium sp. WMS1]|nr:rod shape-determining protein MreD [Achromatium sp. WMS1]